MNTRGAYGDPTEAGYYTKIASAFLKLRGGVSSIAPWGNTFLAMTILNWV